MHVRSNCPPGPGPDPPILIVVVVVAVVVVAAAAAVVVAVAVGAAVALWQSEEDLLVIPRAPAQAFLAGRHDQIAW